MPSSRQIFESHTGNLIHKWNHYFEIYDKYFERYAGKEVVVLEIGVSQGGSISLWENFFGKNLIYYGIDINPKCKGFEKENVKIFIGSQEDISFLETVKKEIKDIDILMDDGGHTMKQQIVTFETLFEKIKYGGIYLCEDNHTSYWPGFGGGLRRKGTFIEYVKNLIDVMHSWYLEKNNSLRNQDLREQIYAIHIHDSIVVIEKRKITPPFDVKKGNLTVGYVEETKQNFFARLPHYIYSFRNKIKSIFR